MKAAGQCLCGAIRFELTLYKNSVVHCHCSICRRAHGAPFVTWVGGSTESLRFLSGKEQLKSYRSTPECRRSYCAACGSPLFFESERWPQETSVALPHLKEPKGLAPRAHIYFSDKLSWLEIDDKLPRYGGKTGVEPLSPDTPPYQPSGPA